MRTLYTFLHSDNRKPLVAFLAAFAVWLASYNGILPAPLDQYKDVIQMIAAAVSALGLVKLDPKTELK